MDNPEAFAQGRRNQEKPLMVFDWHRAAHLIRKHKPEIAGAGLKGDWEWTGGTIFRREVGAPALGEAVVDSYTYLASTWAVPELSLDGQRQDCWCWASATDGWVSNTKWPETALKILRGEVQYVGEV